MGGDAMMRSLAMMTLFLLPVTASGAETVRLRHVGSIYSDVAGLGIIEPEGVGCGRLTITVADTGHGRLQQYTLSEGTIKPGTEIRASQLTYPQRVRLNSKGDIFVLDGKQHRILRLNATGEFTGYVEPQGLPGPVPSWIPKSLAIDSNDNLSVLDVSASRVVILNAEGKFQKQLTLPQTDGFFSDVAVDAQGTIFLLDSVTASVYSAARDAAAFSLLTMGLKEYVNFPISLAVDRKRIYVVDQNGGRIAVLGKDGAFQGHKLRMGWKEGELRYPSDICLDDAGKLIIADRGNNRVQVFLREEESK
jgi:DNA-binding beta-propeller fold protein YncE